MAGLQNSVKSLITNSIVLTDRIAVGSVTALA